jgi:hypothetical protein
VEYVSWSNHERLHEALGDIPPVEYEQLHAPKPALIRPISGNGSVAAIAHKPADGLSTRRFSPLGADLELDGLISAENAPVTRTLLAQAAPQAGQR